MSYKNYSVRIPQGALTHTVMVELYVTNILNREELRALCDEHRTQEGILEHLK